MDDFLGHLKKKLDRKLLHMVIKDTPEYKQADRANFRKFVRSL